MGGQDFPVQLRLAIGVDEENFQVALGFAHDAYGRRS